MTRAKNEYFYGSSYTREEAMEIIEKFFIRKLEQLLKITTVILSIVAIIALYRGEKLLKEADEFLEKSEHNSSIYEERLSVEEEFWKYIDSLEVPECDVQQAIIVEAEIVVNYVPSEQERQWAYCVAFAEAGIESELGQILVINAAINNMRAEGYSDLIEEFTSTGRYSSVISGKVYNCGEVVTVDDVPQNVKEAVDSAFEYDYSEEMLKEQAEKLGITDSKYWEGGARYFYNPEFCSDFQNKLRENVKVKFKCGSHVFYRYWDE